MALYVDLIRDIETTGAGPHYAFNFAYVRQQTIASHYKADNRLDYIQIA